MVALTAQQAHAAVDAKDARFDGVFYTGVTSTGVYCRCICPARTPKRENRTFHQSAAAAEEAGFRPCLICRPELAQGAAPIDATARLASQALARIEAGALETQGLSELAADLGVTDRHLRRVMVAQFGASPVALAQTHRLLTAKRLLTETDLPITTLAFASGFQSVRRFNVLFQERYRMAPSKVRARRAAKGQALSLRLLARGPFDAAAALAFLQPRMIGGLDTSDGGYRRTLQIGTDRGMIRIAPRADGVTLEASDSLTPALRPLVAAVRGAFDLDCDPLIIAETLGDARFDGAPRAVRIPGGVDAYEIAVRAIIGQQVTVSAARTVTERVVRAFGEPIETGVPGLTTLFPTPQRLADATAGAIAALGMPLARAQTLIDLSCAVADGRVKVMRGAVDLGRAGLSTIKGIGPWTIEYVALRGLGDPDAFPDGDSAIKAALGVKTGAVAIAEAWRPWRAYAAVRLWARFGALKRERKS
jgi:AraC family transcriptional regulator of adaptative response / DNA-3-methyladenine glycosylase II